MSATRASEALLGLLRELPARVDPAAIDRVWLFSPRDLNGRESGLVVLSQFTDGTPTPEHRRVLTVRYEAERARGGVQRVDTVVEQGFVPEERVAGLISGVLRRLGDATEDPADFRVGGDPDRWAALLAELAGEPVDRPDGE